MKGKEARPLKSKDGAKSPCYPAACVSHGTSVHSLRVGVNSPSSLFAAASQEPYIFNSPSTDGPPGYLQGFATTDSVVINNHLCITAGLHTLISPKISSQI